MEPVKVLYLIDSLTHGGTERQVAELVRRLDRRRVRPHLCTLKPSGGLYDELELPKACLDFSSFAAGSLAGVLGRLSRFVRQNGIDIVQTFFQDPFLLAALIKPLHRVKLIGSFRDLGFWRNGAESRKMRLACRAFDGFIANSRAVKAHFAARDKLPPDRIEVIYNGLDLCAVPPPPPRSAETVGIVANLNRPVKRVEDFIKAAALLHRKRPGTSFAVVGGGHLQPALERLAAQSGIAGCTTFTGMVPAPLELAAAFSVGVITSQTEGFCNAIMEYMACGIPVVATGVGGNPELVETGVNGYLYEPGDVDALCGALRHLLESPEERIAMGRANRRKIAEHFTMEKMLGHTESYYRTIGRLP